MPKFHAQILLLFAVAGCSLFGGKTDSPSSTQAAGTSTRDTAYAAATADRCEQSVAKAEAKVTKALAVAAGQGNGPDRRPLEPSGIYLAKLRKDKVSLSLRPLEHPDGGEVHASAQGLLILEDSLGDEARHWMEHPPKTAAQKRKLQRYSQRASRAVYVVNSLRYQMNELGFAYMEAHMAGLMCDPTAIALHIENMNRMGHPSVRPNMALEREALARIVRKTDEADALGAATLGVVSVYQAAITHAKDPALVDRAVTQVSAAIPIESERDPTPEVDATLARAAEHMEAALAEQEAVRDQLQAQAAEAHSARPAAAPAAQPNAIHTRAQTALKKGAAVVSAVTAVASGNYLGAVQGVAALMPEGSRIHHALNGASALMGGNYVGALKSAAALAPKSSKLAGVMSGLLGRVG